MANRPFESTTVGEIVAKDFRAAAVFERFGIDFCCGGRRTVAEACQGARADTRDVAVALEALQQSSDDERDALADWPLDRLADHIVNTHHAYVRTALPQIAQHLRKLVEVHGERHPELERVEATFGRMGTELLQHMMKEERVLFPYIRELASGPVSLSPFGSIEHPIRMMEREHQNAGRDLDTMRELTTGYLPPADGCSTYKVTMAELAAFELDLHRHVHLENNILFPRAIQDERERLR